MFPRLEYPAGFVPIIDHSINIRGAVTALVEGQAQLFHLETHVAFFATIRNAIILATAGIF